MTERTCAGCTAVIVPGERERNPKKWCSDACRRKWYWRNHPTYAKSQNDRSNSAQKAARAERGPLSYEKVCPHCEEPFTTGQSRRRYCSDTCARRSGHERRKADGRKAEQARRHGLKYQHKRRALEREAFVAEVDRWQVFDRDGWICGICSGPVDPALKYPDLQSASLDHIIPLAAGGTHEPDNCQCSHFLCNSRKSDTLPSLISDMEVSA